jgi:hypothetical protein
VTNGLEFMVNFLKRRIISKYWREKLYDVGSYKREGQLMEAVKKEREEEIYSVVMALP